MIVGRFVWRGKTGEKTPEEGAKRLKKPSKMFFKVVVAEMALCFIN